GVAPADGVEGERLPGLVAGGPVQADCLLGVVEGLNVAAMPLPHLAEDYVGLGLHRLVAGLGGQFEGLTELGVSVVEAAEHGVREGEDAVTAALDGGVRQQLWGGPRGGAGGGRVGV